MSIVFLFGAGASYGNPDCTPAPHPLGMDLFSELNKFGLFHDIEIELAGEFKLNFEIGMQYFFEKYPDRIADTLKSMALYFTQFRPGPENYYSKLIKIIGKNRLVLSTLNYDLLIEGALWQNNLLGSYVGPIHNNMVRVFKLHGSCNFIPYLGKNSFSNCVITPLTSASKIIEGPMKVAESITEIRNYCDSSNSFPPIMSIYMKGKPNLACHEFIIKQQKAWAEEVNSAYRIYIIGTKVNEEDSHIWDVLAKSKAWTGYVGLDNDKEQFLYWAKKHKKKKAYPIATTFKEALTMIKRY